MIKIHNRLLGKDLLVPTITILSAVLVTQVRLSSTMDTQGV